MFSPFSQNYFKSLREQAMYGQLDYSHLIKPVPECQDANKFNYLQELNKLLASADKHFKAHDHIQLCTTSCILAYLCLSNDDFPLAMKMYSLCGEMLIHHKDYELAVVMYLKLRNCAYTDP
jgi:hypothetical protein